MREATIQLSNAELDAFGLTEFVSVFRDAGLRQVNELSCQRPGCLLAITVADAISEEQLSALSELEWWEQLDGNSGVTYLCKLSVPAFDEGFDPYHETDTGRDSMQVTDEGVTITMVGDHTSVSDRVRDFTATGADILLETIGDYDGPAAPLHALTERQQEVLETAFDMGYFAVPRETTTEAVADELGVDPSTVREHLQRAQQNLVTAVLDG